MADLSAVREHIRRNAFLAMQATGETMIQQMKKDAPYESGGLSDSIGYELVDAGSSLILEVFATAPYADYQDKGTNGPYVIGGNPILHFYGADDGAELFREEVFHFGVPATGFFSDVLEQFDSFLEQFLEVLD